MLRQKTTPDTDTTRRGRRTRRGLLASVAAITSLCGVAGLGAGHASAATWNSYGAYVDTVMECNPNAKTVILSALDNRGYDWVRVVRHNEHTGDSEWVSEWMKPSELINFGVNPYQYGKMAVFLYYADWTSDGWDYSWDIARRTDGKGYYC